MCHLGLMMSKSKQQYQEDCLNKFLFKKGHLSWIKRLHFDVELLVRVQQVVQKVLKHKTVGHMHLKFREGHIKGIAEDFI